MPHNAHEESIIPFRRMGNDDCTTCQSVFDGSQRKLSITPRIPRSNCHDDLEDLLAYHSYTSFCRVSHVLHNAKIHSPPIMHMGASLHVGVHSKPAKWKQLWLFTI
jgi:hypothetical protein